MTSRTEDLVTTAEVDEVVAAIEAVDLEAPWSEVAPLLLVSRYREYTVETFRGVRIATTPSICV